MTNEIPKELIQASLALCEYMYDDFMDEIYRWDSYSFSWEYCWPKIEQKFSIEKFFYYLLSPEFIEKYSKLDYTVSFWVAINRYQSWNSEPLIQLLSKIWHQNK